MKTVASFSIPYYRFLNEKGEIEGTPPAFAKDKEYLQSLYRMMVLTRIFDKKTIALQRTGKLGTYPSNLGQEAIGVGIGAAMRDDDVLVPYYREYGAMFWRKVKMEEVWLYWGGDERGSAFEHNAIDFPICVPIASQTLHAAGVASAFKIRNQKRAVVVAVGDGGTSRGDFYEAMNVSGVWELPIVFVINNNGWAISVPTSAQTKAQTLAQKAIAAGIDGIQVDGNDVFAVKDAVEKALQKAHEGKGPSVIEALSYRMGDHTTADDASRYRPLEQLKENELKDPVIRLRSYMASVNFWDEAKEKALHTELTEEVNQALERFDALPKQPASSMFDYLYETLPDVLKSQRDLVMQEAE